MLSNVKFFISSNGPKLALLVVSFIWGITFPLGKFVVASMPLFSYLGIRFSIAAVILFALNREQILKTTPTARRVSCLIGVTLFGAYVLQTAGLLYTTAAKTSFVSGLYVVFVPFLYFLLFRQPLRAPAVIAGVLGSVGLALLGGDISNLLEWDFGVIIVLISSVFVALQIVGIGRYASCVNPAAMAFFQIAVVGVLSLAVGYFTETWPEHIGFYVWVAVAFLVLFATVFAFYVQCWVQQSVDHTATAIIMSMECVFGGWLSWLFLDEPFTAVMLVGAGLLVLAMMVAQLGGTK